MRSNEVKNLIYKTVVVTAISLLGKPTFSAEAPSVAGQWKVHQSIAGHESDQDCTFTVSDLKIAGTCKANEQTPKVTGTVDGKKITWKYDMDYNGSTLTLTYTGTLDDDKLSGSVDVAPYGVSGDFTAQRTKSTK